MILDDSEIDERLGSPKNLVNIIALKRNGSAPRIPEKVNELLGRLRNTSEEKTAEIAEVFDVDSSQVLKQAKKDTSGRDIKIESAHDEALDLMVDSMRTLRTKLNDVDKPVQLSKIASDMSKIVGNLKSKTEEGNKQQVQINIFTPATRKENEYETINLSS